MISKIKFKNCNLSSHDEEMIDQFCNIKIFMENGSIKKIEKFNSSKIFFYTGNHNKIAGIADIIDFLKFERTISN